jgi:hypothetical protein
MQCQFHTEYVVPLEGIADGNLEAIQLLCVLCVFAPFALKILDFKRILT